MIEVGQAVAEVGERKWRELEPVEAEVAVWGWGAEEEQVEGVEKMVDSSQSLTGQGVVLGMEGQPWLVWEPEVQL